MSESAEGLKETIWDWFMQPRPGVFIAVFILGCSFEILVHLVLNLSVAYTHFYYLIIVLAGLWYPKRALAFAAFFGGLYASVDFLHTGSLSAESLFRVVTMCLVAVVISNIVLRMNAQTARIQDSQKALYLANKKLNLLSSITRHDINNQLMGLLAFIELAKPKSMDPELLHFIERQEMAARNIQRQIAFTKDYEDIGIRAPQWQKVENIVSAAGSARLSEQVSMEVVLDGLEIYADPLLEKIFGNLIDNSLRHGKHVNRIWIHYQMNGPDLCLVYRDNGVGIAESDKEHIFEKGFGQNTGMGLFLSQEILNITGISIRETGTRGECARFEILVPTARFRFRPDTRAR